MKRADWVDKRDYWASAMMQIAHELGKESTLYQILGSVAWGRYDGEPAPSEIKDNVIFGVGFLEGVRYAALQAGRALKLEGTLKFEGIHDRFRIEKKR